MTLKTARDARELTMEQLAEQSGISKATISRLEAGEIANPSNSTVIALETALGLTRGTLVFGAVIGKAS